MSQEKDKAESKASAVKAPQEPRGMAALFKSEDWWAIWLGLAIIIAAMLIFLPRSPEGMQEKFDQANATINTEEDLAPFKTIAWYEACNAKRKIKASSEPHGATLKKWTSKPHGWEDNPLIAFVLDEESARQKATEGTGAFEEAKAKTSEAEEKALQAQQAAAAAGFQNDALNQEARTAIEAWRGLKAKESKAKKKAGTKPYNQVGYLLGLCAAMGLLFSIGIAAMRKGWGKFVAAFPAVFLIAVLSFLLASQSDLKGLGIGYAAWAIIFGLLISNTIGTPKWLTPAVQTEYYIKTGLVLLGAEILFGKILVIGVPGIFVAWIVTPIVLISTYLFGQKILKLSSKTLNITISADMSVCGVSAAIATAAACRAKKEELTLAVGLSLIFTSIMMIVMPNFIRWVGMPEVLGGAWMGGTIDATGAVAAAGAFLGDKALYVAATIKMIQNVLIGIIAFCVALYWCTKVDRSKEQAVGAGEIWHRFPKFVLGFIGASILFSVLYQGMGADAGYTMIDQGVIRGFTKTLRGWFFCLAFVSIGLATNFRELGKYFKGGKPLILYVCGQSFNLILTLSMAYLMFYIIFKSITDSI